MDDDRRARMTRRHTLAGLGAGALALGMAARADAADRDRLPQGMRFASVDGGDLALDDFAGQVMLVVNTASRCGFTPQFEGLQAVYEAYRDAGLVVIAVPSNDFRQELDTGAAAQEFCQLTYGVDMPMTDLTRVTGRQAHPFYRWLAQSHGVKPVWNFHKVLIGRDGRYVDDWSARTRPEAPAVRQALEAALAAAV